MITDPYFCACDQRVVINIFDVRTGKVRRDFKGSADEFAVGGTGGLTGVNWPIFK